MKMERFLFMAVRQILLFLTTGMKKAFAPFFTCVLVVGETTNETI
jgi:hypothetical protein